MELRSKAKRERCGEDDLSLVSFKYDSPKREEGRKRMRRKKNTLVHTRKFEILVQIASRRLLTLKIREMLCFYEMRP